MIVSQVSRWTPDKSEIGYADVPEGKYFPYQRTSASHRVYIA